MARSNRWKSSFFCLLQCSVADGVAVHHSVSLTHIAHVMGIICHSLWLYGLPVTVAEITSCRGIVDICQHIYVAFVASQYCCHVAPFKFHFLGS
jgi:hypothetical protein